MREAIDDCKWIFLRFIGEPEGCSLRLVIEEAKADGPPEDIEISPGRVITGTVPIESDPTCREFELVWPSYVSYSVRNESFCTLDEEEMWEGRLLRRYAKSHFLDHVAKSTFAGDDYPGPLHHWGVNGLNHIVDVVSVDEPLVREISQA